MIYLSGVLLLLLVILLLGLFNSASPRLHRTWSSPRSPRGPLRALLIRGIYALTPSVVLYVLTHGSLLLCEG